MSSGSASQRRRTRSATVPLLVAAVVFAFVVALVVEYQHVQTVERERLINAQLQTNVFKWSEEFRRDGWTVTHDESEALQRRSFRTSMLKLDRSGSDEVVSVTLQCDPEGVVAAALNIVAPKYTAKSFGTVYARVGSHFPSAAQLRKATDALTKLEPNFPFVSSAVSYDNDYWRLGATYSEIFGQGIVNVSWVRIAAIPKIEAEVVENAQPAGSKDETLAAVINGGDDDRRDSKGVGDGAEAGR